MSCLRNSRQILSKIAVVEGINLPGPLIKFVRGVKPRWLPKSQSKIFYVRTPTPIDPVEHTELRTGYFHYRTAVRAVRKFMRAQQSAKMDLMQEQSTEVQDLADDLQLMEEQNNQWNKRVGVIREEAWLEEREKQEKRLRYFTERDELRKSRRLQKAEEKLHKDLADSKSFITLDSLDMEIEKLMNLRQDYNFAIDKQGNKISESVSDEDGAKVSESVEQEISMK